MRIFGKLLIALGVLVALPVLAAALLLAEPQWFLTSGTVARAARAFGSAYHPGWKTLSFEIRSLSFAEKQVRLRAQDLCFRNAAAGVDGCVKELDARFDVRLYFLGVKLTKLYSLKVAGDHFTFEQNANRQTAAAKANSGLPASLPALLPEALRGLELESLNVDLPENRIVLGSGTLRGRLRLNLSGSIPRPLVLKFELEHSSGTVTRHYLGEAALSSDILKGMPMTYLDARGSLKAEGVDGKFKARVDQSGPGELSYALSASAKVPARRIQADFKGSQKGQQVSLSGSAGVWESTGPVRSVRLKECAVEVRLKPASTEWDAVKLASRFELVPAAFGVKNLRHNFAGTLGGRLTASVSSTPGVLAGDHFDAEAAVALEPAKDWYELSGGAEAKVSGRASRVQDLKISYKFGFGLKVARFEDLVEFLSNTTYSIPAPLNVLHGPLGVAVSGGGDPRMPGQVLDYTVSSGLAAGKQALKFEAVGKVTAAGLWGSGLSFKDETDLVLNDIALQLPRLDMKGMAALTPDSRIKTGAEAALVEQDRAEERRSPGKSAATGTPVELRVKTAKPALLYSNLAMDPVPVGLDLDFKLPAGNLGGTVEVRRFRANIFRRVASIDHIKFTGRPGSPVMDIDGLVVYKAADANISIHLLGTTQKPQVEFESNPPMTQADIVAMLLFGKSPNELDSDQQSSAANAQSAVANSAFGLASLYLLASTPVEYVGYDPVAKTYTVKFRLPGGATLQVGSAGQSGAVQLRKRISTHLAIQSEFTSTQTQGNIVTTLLEWYGRR